MHPPSLSAAVVGGAVWMEESPHSKSHNQGRVSENNPMPSIPDIMALL